MQKTTNLELNKPDYTDVADIADINANMDILDEAVAGKADGRHDHNNGADLTNVDAAKLGGKAANMYALDGSLANVAKTGNYNDLTNKPTSMAADGGNADTVGNKSADEFAACSVLRNVDFNDMTIPGLYEMHTYTNAPLQSWNIYGLIVLNEDKDYMFVQIAAAGLRLFVRNSYGSAGNVEWNDWKEIGVNTAAEVATTLISAVSGNYNVTISASNTQNALQKLAEQIVQTKSANGALSTSLNAHTGATSGAHTASAVSASTVSAANGSYSVSFSGSVQNILQGIAEKLVTMMPSPHTYRKVYEDITGGTWYKAALCNFASGNAHSGGCAVIRINAYSQSGKRQTIEVNAAYSGSAQSGGREIEVIHSMYTQESEKMFDKAAIVSHNYGFIAFRTANAVTNANIHITVESSITENRVDIKANDKTWSTASDGDWVWSGGGEHYWNIVDL